MSKIYCNSKAKRKSTRKHQFTDEDYIDMKMYDYLRKIDELMSEINRLRLTQSNSIGIRDRICFDEIKHLRECISDLACWGSEEYCDKIHNTQITYIDDFLNLR